MYKSMTRLCHIYNTLMIFFLFLLKYINATHHKNKFNTKNTICSLIFPFGLRAKKHPILINSLTNLTDCSFCVNQFLARYFALCGLKQSSGINAAWPIIFLQKQRAGT